MSGERIEQRRVWPWLAGLGGLLALDQFTKHLIRANFELHESIPILGDSLLRLTYVRNPGIAFGLDFINPTVLRIFGWTAAVLLAVYLFHLVRRADPLRWPVFLFLAGAIGNTIDRTFFGKVTDFVDADFPDFIMDRWPVFNVADSCVTIGITLLVLITLFGYSSRSKTATPPPHDRSTRRTDSLPNSDGGGTAPAAD